jgi:hypothetical protein
MQCKLFIEIVQTLAPESRAHQQQSFVWNGAEALPERVRWVHWLIHHSSDIS